MFKQGKWAKLMISVVIIASLVLILPVSVAYAHVQLPPPPPPPGPLGTAADFAVLGASTVTNTGLTVVNGGHVGVSPGSAITGFFPPGVVNSPGTIHLNDAAAQQAHTDAQTAYNNLAAATVTQDLTGQDLGNVSTLANPLTPGVYHFNTSAQLTGTLYLDAQSNPNSVFIFQIGSTLTTASGSSVIVINAPANWCSKYWQVGSAATLGTSTAFVGTIIAHDSITMNTSASLYGRALALNAAVTLDTNAITVPVCSINAPPAPTPELPTVILLSVGLVGMGSYFVIRSKNQKRKLGNS
jgi:type VI secretion system secreted protein VgrG